jgi:hypothetical protein
MLHQWSILLHGTRNGRMSIVRRRDIDPAGAGGGSADTAAVDTSTAADTTAVDTSAVDTSTDITQPDGAPAAPDFDKLFDDEAAAAVDPNAPLVPGAIPPEYAEAMAISPYVKDATQLQGAVQLADQVIKVQNGEAPISGLLENFRAQNGPAFEKMARQELIPYIEQITGMKLMDPATQQAAEKTPEQQRLDAIEQHNQTQATNESNQRIQRQVTQAQGVLVGAADTALKGTWLEGKGLALLSQIAPHMGMNEEQATRALLAGNTTMVATAVKAMIAQKTAEGKAYAKWAIAESRKIKGAVPASPGNSRSGEPAIEAMTREQRIAFLSN